MTMAVCLEVGKDSYGVVTACGPALNPDGTAPEVRTTATPSETTCVQCRRNPIHFPKNSVPGR